MSFELISKDISRETSIILLVDNHRRGSVKGLTMDLMRTQGLINRTIEECFTVISPSHGSNSLYTEVDIVTGGKISNLQCIFCIGTCFIIQISSFLVVWAHDIILKDKSVFPLCHFIYIKEDFFRGIHAPFATAIGKILFSFFATVVVVVTIVKGGISLVIFLNTPENLIIDGLLQFFGRSHYCISISIFCFKVFYDFRIGFVLKPVIRVGALFSEILKSFRDSLSYRSRRKLILIERGRFFLLCSVTRSDCCECSN